MTSWPVTTSELWGGHSSSGGGSAGRYGRGVHSSIPAGGGEERSVWGEGQDGRHQDGGGPLPRPRWVAGWWILPAVNWCVCVCIWSAGSKALQYWPVVCASVLSGDLMMAESMLSLRGSSANLRRSQWSLRGQWLIQHQLLGSIHRAGVCWDIWPWTSWLHTNCITVFDFWSAAVRTFNVKEWLTVSCLPSDLKKNKLVTGKLISLASSWCFSTAAVKLTCLFCRRTQEGSRLHGWVLHWPDFTSVFTDDFFNFLCLKFVFTQLL